MYPDTIDVLAKNWLNNTTILYYLMYLLDTLELKCNFCPLMFQKCTNLLILLILENEVLGNCIDTWVYCDISTL